MTSRAALRFTSCEGCGGEAGMLVWGAKQINRGSEDGGGGIQECCEASIEIAKG